MNIQPLAPKRPDETQKVGFVFVLLEGFSALSMTSAIETLRITNETIGTAVFEWSFISERGTAVRNSQGQMIQPEAALVDVRRETVVVVCGGVDIAKNTTPAVLSWLRRQSVLGAHFVGLCTAAYTFAKAGLLDSKSAAIHWQESEWFAELFPETSLSERPFERDGKISTTAGGVSAIDLFLELLSERAGHDVIEKVADRLLYRSIRNVQSNTKLRKSYRIGFGEPKLVRAIAIMESNLEDQVSIAGIALEIGISTRQLERLFRRHLDTSPGQFAMSLRLDRSLQLLMSTDLSIIEVAIACGFATPSNFSKCFRREYGTTPMQMRKARSL